MADDLMNESEASDLPPPSVLGIILPRITRYTLAQLRKKYISLPQIILTQSQRQKHIH